MKEEKKQSFKIPFSEKVEENVRHAITSNYQNSAYITKGDKGLAIGLVS